MNQENKKDKKDKWYEKNYSSFFIAILTIFSSLFFILNNYIFLNKPTTGLNIIGGIFLMIVWLSFLGILIDKIFIFYKKNVKHDKDKNKTVYAEDITTQIFFIIMTIIIFIFAIFVLPKYLVGLGYIWKGSLRHWNLSEIKESQGIQDIIFTFPLIITNFLFGWNVIPAFISLFQNPYLQYFKFLGLSFNPSIVPVLYGDGEKPNNNTKGGFATYASLLPKWFLNILNFGLLPKYLNPLDWDEVDKLNRDVVIGNKNKGSYTVKVPNGYISNGSDNVIWGGGYYWYWIGISLFIIIISNVLSNVFNPIGNSFFGSVILMMMIIIYMVVKSITKTDKCFGNMPVKAFGLPCSEMGTSEDLIMTIKGNLIEYIEKMFSKND